MSRKEHTRTTFDARRKKRPKKTGKRKNARKGRWRTASTSDRHELYELAVQDPAGECSFIEQAWKERRGRVPHHIREDFCGTGQVCREWVKRSRSNTAIGIDLDPAVLAWGAARRKRMKPDQLKRMKFINADVRTVKTKLFDSVLAMNFSYYIIQDRNELLDYFRVAHRALVKDGLFLLDAYGGSDSYREIEEPRDLDGFTYIWDQNYVNPITGRVVNHIHFEFPDSTKMKKAFTYDWRLWSLPELKDLLRDAGFKNVLVYWEGTDKKTGEGDGVWTISDRGEACAGWVAYLVAEK
jgi:SAM-dependent methyltransferase